MRSKQMLAGGLVAMVGLSMFVAAWAHETVVDDPAAAATKQVVKQLVVEAEPKVKPAAPNQIPAFVQKGLKWLMAAQHNDGGWGGGSHAAQNIRDPHQVKTDPATTAFTLLSLMRAGYTPVAGDYQKQIRRGTKYLVSSVEKAPTEGPLITDIQGTQPQSKLGRYVDTSMTAQYLARVLPLLSKESKLRKRVDKALDKCLVKLQGSQQKNGSWGGGGWAPVLQSSLSTSALEIAEANGKPIDKQALKRARSYQKGNFVTSTGQVSSGDAAGVDLYAFNGAFRASATEAREAEELVNEAKRKGDLDADAPINEDSLRIAGVVDKEKNRELAEAVVQNRVQIERLGDEKLLKGFGNNGGEEFLSYLMTSESLVIAGGDKFQQWNGKMLQRLAKLQNTDGSWNGHHCITSPVFCTAAVVQCLTTDRDAEFLIGMAKRTTDSKLASANK